MKKLLTLLAMTSMLALAGCTETAVEEPKEEKKVEASTTEKVEVEDEAKAEAKAKEEASKKVEANKKLAAEEKAKADKKAKEAEQAAQDTKNAAYAQEVGEYSSTLGDIMNDFTDNVNNFNHQTKKKKKDPFITMDSEWITDTVLVLLSIQANIDSINEIQPPAGFEEIHSLNQKLGEEWQFVVDNFPTAIDNLDTALIQECATHIQLGTGYTEEVNRLLEVKFAELKESGVF